MCLIKFHFFFLREGIFARKNNLFSFSFYMNPSHSFYEKKKPAEILHYAKILPDSRII